MIEGPGVWVRYREDEVTRQQVRPGDGTAGLAMHGVFQVGTLVAFVALVWQLYGPLNTMSGLPTEVSHRAGRLDEQAERIAALEVVVADLRERLEASERARSRNSGNSSMPPDTDDQPGRKPPRAQRRAAKRAEKKRRGKQPGSPGASMAWEVPDRTEDHYPGGACSCGADLAGAADLGVARSFQQEEIPAAPAERVQHDLREVRCGCGRVHAAARPAGVPAAALSAGPRLRALTVYLVVFQHVPVERCRLLIADVTGACVSDGFVHSCLARAASLAAEVVALIRALITASPVAGFDETTLRSGPAGEKKYVHGAFTEDYSAFWLGTRGLESMEDAGILPGFAGVAVSDRYQKYWSTRWEHIAGHQACLAQILRDFEDCAEAYPGTVWPEQAQRALRGMIRAWHAARELGLPAVPADALAPLEHEFRHAVLAGLASVPRVPGPKTTVKQKSGRELLEFCKDRKDDVLLKTRQKVSGRLASDDVTQNRLDIRSCIDTARKHGRNAMEVLHQLMLGTPWRPPGRHSPRNHRSAGHATRHRTSMG